jgi:adenylosuccinate synthase
VILRQAKAAGDRILVEGANAAMLDIDAGTFPYVTSSNTGVGGVLTGLTLDWRILKDVIGVVKAYTTRVGSGPFPTEQLNEIGEKLQSFGREVGVTTGRKRRCGWLDLVIVKYSSEVNNYTAINFTKLDILDDFEEIKVATDYLINGESLGTFPASIDMLNNLEVKYTTLPGWKASTTKVTKWDELPANARKYVEYVEEFVGVPIQYIGTGPGREDMILR